MPVLICSYCGKRYKVSNSRYELSTNGTINQPSCSRSCKDKLSSITPRKSFGSTTNNKAKGLFKIGGENYVNNFNKNPEED